MNDLLNAKIKEAENLAVEMGYDFQPGRNLYIGKREDWEDSYSIHILKKNVKIGDLIRASGKLIKIVWRFEL